MNKVRIKAMPKKKKIKRRKELRKPRPKKKLDGKGPDGKGPRTGRGLGPCEKPTKRGTK